MSVVSMVSQGASIGMVRKQKEPRAKKSILELLMRDTWGSGVAKLVLFEKSKAAGGFANTSAAELRKVENMLRAVATM